MRAFFDQGAREARAALALNPKLAWAYGLLVEQQKGEAGPGLACRPVRALSGKFRRATKSGPG